MKHITPALKFEDLLFENKTNYPKNGRFVKLFEAQDIDDETGDGLTQTQEQTQPQTQTHAQPISDENAYNEESLLDETTQSTGGSAPITTDKGANAGGGIMPICTTTGKILLGRRSDRVSEPGTWSIWGGRLDIATTGELNENNIKNKVQEVFESMTKYNKFEELIPSYIYKTKENEFEWHNYIGLVDEEFEPMHDWRIIEYKWLTMGEIRGLGRDNLHYGLQLLFDNDSDTIRPLLVPKPKEEIPTQEVPPQGQSMQEVPPQETQPQETPQQDTLTQEAPAEEFGEAGDGLDIENETEGL